MFSDGKYPLWFSPFTGTYRTTGTGMMRFTHHRGSEVIFDAGRWKMCDPALERPAKNSTSAILDAPPAEIEIRSLIAVEV
jgi:hypothetical protein